MAQVHPSRLRLVPGANEKPRGQSDLIAASVSARAPPRAESREEQLRQQLLERRKGDLTFGSNREGADGSSRHDKADGGRDYHHRSASPASRSLRRGDRDRVRDDRRSPPRRELFPDIDSRRDRALSPRRERDDRIPSPRRYDDQARNDPGPSSRYEVPPHLARGRGDNGDGPRPANGGGSMNQAGPMPPFPPQFAPRDGGGGGGGGYGRDRHFGQNMNLEQRRQQREASTISVWPPSPKAPYKDEDELEAERLAAQREKSKSKRKHRSRYSSDSDSADGDERVHRRRRRDRKRYSSTDDSSEEERDRRRSHRRRKSRRRATDTESEDGTASEAEPTRRRGKRERSRRTGSRSAAPDSSAVEEAEEWVEKPVKSDTRDKAEEAGRDKGTKGRDDQPLTLEEMAEMQRRQAEEDTEVGPQLPAEYTTKAGQMHFKDMRPGEAAAMAAYASNGERIPRRGEIGQDAEAIKALEDSGYVMSGSRHRRMNAVRLRKENQVISAEEKRAILNLQREEKERREGMIVSQFKELMEGAIKRQGG